MAGGSRRSRPSNQDRKRPSDPNNNSNSNQPHNVQRSYASQLKEHEPLFNTYEHLQGLPDPGTALMMLRKIASLVKPIMRKHNWKVQVLAEFLPPEANLLGLNINRGYKICVRLRYHNHPDLFLPVEQVVDTMLHELSHNVWGEHDARFHRLWDELRDEHDVLVSKGYTGEGFLTEGHRLGGWGGGFDATAREEEMRRRARSYAKQRQKYEKLSQGSGQRLGGTPLHLMGGRDVRNVIVDQVKRRNTINTGCGSGRNDAIKLSDDSAGQSFSTQAEEDDANDRAIAQALYELIEEEEDRKLRGTLASAPSDGGLAWNPDSGLYDPRTEGPHVPAPSEEEQMKWAMDESIRTASQSDESNSTSLRDFSLPAPVPIRGHPSASAANNTSAFAPALVSPPLVSPLERSHTSAFASRPVSTVSSLASPQRSRTNPYPKSPSSQHHQRSPIKKEEEDDEPLIDLSEPFDPLLASRAANGTLPCSSPPSSIPAFAHPGRSDAVDSTSTPLATSSARYPTATVARSSTPPQQRQYSQHPENQQTPVQDQYSQWTCEACTFINPARYLACDVCGTERGLTQHGYLPDSASRYGPEAGSVSAFAPAPAPSTSTASATTAASSSSAGATSAGRARGSGRGNGESSRSAFAPAPTRVKQEEEETATTNRASSSTYSSSRAPTSSRSAPTTTHAGKKRPSTAGSHSAARASGPSTSRSAFASASSSSSSTKKKNSTAPAAAVAVVIPPAPLGWVCKSCGSFMETKWWTCSACGRMKESS